MPTFQKTAGSSLDETISVDQVTTVILNGRGALFITRDTVPVATLKDNELNLDGDNKVELDVAGVYRLYMPAKSCSNATVQVSVPIQEDPPLADAILPVTYLPNGVAPCVEGFVVAKEQTDGSLIITLTSKDGAVLNTADNPWVSA